ncbi:hypothetical protein Tco_0116740 [Tanacetum coccineum]
MYHDLCLGEKALTERENVGFDLTKSDLCLSFIEDLTMKGVGLRVADSHTDPLRARRGGLRAGGEGTSLRPSVECNVYIYGFIAFNFITNVSKFQVEAGYIVPSNYSELLLEDNKLDNKSFKDVLPTYARDDPLYRQIATYPINARTFLDPILYLAGLKTSWNNSPKNPIIYYRGREMDFRSFMMEGIDGEFHFIPEGGVGDERGSFSPRVSASSKAAGKRMQTAESSEREPRQKVQKVLPQASKVAGDASDPLDIDSDPDIHEFPSAKELKDSADFHFVVTHVTPPSWKRHLKEISLEKLCDIHDRAYMRQAMLDNMLNSRTRKLILILSKARASYDAIRERRLRKTRHMLNLRGVDQLHGEYSRLVLEEKKWVNYEQTLSILRSKVKGLESEKERLKSFETQLSQEIDGLRQDRADVVSKVIPHVATKLIRSDEMGLLVARLAKAAMFRGRRTTFEEVADLKEPFDLEKMHGYHSSSKKEFD